ncbi:ParB/RepB/Spo0J family partition protein [Streptomyces sp. NBC_00487]|uniref:ParB/RepB/Spo0J family partition protein n=1 Tax=Streptomyces sp. NBC_00487 TaxID=2903656 RepID=UPI002E1707D0
MSDRRRGLGRGLAALIPAAATGEKESPPAGAPAPQAATSVFTPERGLAASKVVTLPPVSRETEELSPNGAAELPAAPIGAYFAELPLDSITPNPRQPREVFDEDLLQELVTSIKEVGLLQPIVVRQVGPSRYELIMGERRWRACHEAELEAIPAIVRATDDEKLLLDALLENLHRAQLNPLEEAFAYDQLLKDFNCTHDQLADRIGRSRPQVSNTLVEDSEEQDKLAHRIVAEGLSVRAVEEIVTLMGSHPKSTARSKGPRAGSVPSPALGELATRLSDRFETRVKIDLGQKKGKITVEFASTEDLERILSTLAPGEKLALQKSLLDDDSEETEA